MNAATDNPAPDSTQTSGAYDSSEAKAFYDSIAPKKKPKLVSMESRKVT